MNKHHMKRILAVLLIAVLLPITLSGCAVKGSRPAIGVAWAKDQDIIIYTAVCDAIKEAGGKPVKLEMVTSADLDYKDNTLVSGTNEDGSLTEESAKLVRSNTWQTSNTEDVMEDISAVVFPGGEDISPSLYYEPEPVKNSDGFSGERDVSDYLLMSYCLEHDVPTLAICRGMQMLCVVSGAKLAQDIPTYMKENGRKYEYQHSYDPKLPEAERDYVLHDVRVLDRDSLLFKCMSTDEIKNVPSWHHQAVIDTKGTRLAVTGVTETSGTDFIEVVERPDKPFVLGLQYHAEIAVNRKLDDKSLSYFTALVEAAGKN